MMRRALPLLTLLALAGCTAAGPGPAPDDRDAVAVPGGKADSVAWTACELEAVVGWLNDPATTERTLEEAGVHARAAGNLIDHRNGPDGAYGTDDDDRFDDIREVDDVYYVGPAAMEQLVAAVADTCGGADLRACTEREVLAWLNDPATTAADLEAAGVHARSAGNLIDYRNGPDGIAGTDDDERFDDLQEVDDVYWVGSAAMDALRAAVEDRCTASGDGEGRIEVVFSPRERPDSQLAKAEALIREAERSVDVAMYHFRDAGIRDALRDAVARDVRVRLISDTASEDRRDPEGTVSAGLEEDGIDVRWVNKIMHHKFFIVDGPQTALAEADDAVLGTGSGNWTHGGGTVYDENTLFVHGNRELILRFQKEFNLMWENSRELEWDEELEYFTTLPIAEEDIEDDPAVDVAYTSSNFRTYVSSRYGPTFSTQFDVSTVNTRLVDLIRDAEERILVASGHLRSRPISEAILEKHALDPDVEIRVLLDGQEYVSQWAQYQQEQELDDCLAEAVDDRDEQECLRRGYMFSYEVHRAGIPLRYKYYAYRWHYSYAKQMHHKYMLVDDVLATGSYNYSDTAEHDTFENVIFLDAEAYPDVVAQYESNFARLWDLGRDGTTWDDLMADVQEGDDPFPMVFDPVSATWPEVDSLREAMREACPDINTADYRNHPERHWTCYP